MAIFHFFFFTMLILTKRIWQYILHISHFQQLILQYAEIDHGTLTYVYYKVP